ncbi:unnamed protein product [Diamesa serratosioi]
MRVKKKQLLFVSGSIVSIFLILYLYLNQKIPSDKGGLVYIEQKLKQLENGLNKHKLKFSEIKKRIDTIKVQGNENTIYNEPNLKNELLERDEIIPRRNEGTCNINTDSVPKPDIQMLDVYRELPFDNPDGGVWKQGWKVEYDPHQWNRHHKLKVFVVPHSHNDPGWINTFDEYYERSTKQIFANMLRHLDEHENFKFIWAEIVYFSRWYDSQHSKQTKDTVKKFVKRKQLEFVTGGWVMPDEANSHWYSVLQSLTEGQTWLKKTFNITPVSSWAIDPFGHSSSFAYILKESGFENLLIQRTHYSVKKYLAQKRQLEFRWRQNWDTQGSTDLFTHMMPFYSYDIPHTCGPEPKVCCQFDFKRLPGYGLNCPWKVPPQPINDANVAKRAELIVDQWRKKSVLYNTRSVFIPLGDDFRFTQSMEWEAQRENYEKLFEYINNSPSLNVEAKFGTLQEYFDSVKKEKGVENFPSLSGDFFTYADRDDNYWSGYFTSRPYYKRMDRILMNYLRSAEMLHSWNDWDSEAGFDELLQTARQALSIFQHHDGVAGTAKDYVMLDYNNMMTEGIKAARFVMQQSVYRLLTQPNIYQADFKFQYFNIDDSRSAGNDETRSVIIIGDEIPFKYVVLHNSLPYTRNELVEFHIAKPFVTVTDSEDNVVNAQVTPVWLWHKSPLIAMQPQASTTKYRLLFNANVPPLGLSVYKINAKKNADESMGTKFSKITILTDVPYTGATLKEYPEKIEFSEPRETSLRLDENSPGASFSKYGMLKSMTIDSNSANFPVHLEFLKYGVRSAQGQKSGAYLFLPDGPATALPIGNPIVLVSEGPLETSITSGLPFALHESILRTGDSMEIRNYVDISDMGNTEIIMRMSTNIKSEHTFYTDLNGLQMMKRERFSKIPLQANYYPIPSAMFIEDSTMRFSLFTSSPLGGSSLKSGEIEIMQDRRLNQDDERGLGQGVIDNKPVLNIFKIVLENREACRKLNENYPSGFLTSYSYLEQKKLMHPMEKLIFNENDWNGVIQTFGENRESAEMGIELVVMRNLKHVLTNKKSSLGLVIHRSNFEECSTDSNRDGILNIRRLLGLEDDVEIFKSHLTLLSKQESISDEINLCPMDTKGFILRK